MILELILVGLAALIQTAAAVSAFLLNRRAGWRWSWTLISMGLAVMAVRRVITFYRFWEAGDRLQDAGLISETAAVVTLVSSIFLFCGVWLIRPLMKSLAEHEKQLNRTNDELRLSLNLAEADLSVARFIQERLFPPGTFHGKGVVISGKCQPMRFAGGDYFDYFSICDGRLAVAVADVSGHGVGPAILMAELRACLRTAGRRISDPEQLATEANHLISEIGSIGRFVTLFIAVIDSDSRTVKFVGAGHEAWLIAPDGTFRNLTTGHLPLGINSDEDYVASEFDIIPNSTLLLATDGVSETCDTEGRMFGTTQMMQYVTDTRGLPPETQINGLFETVTHFRGAAELTDDITAVAVRFVDETDAEDIP